MMVVVTAGCGVAVRATALGGAAEDGAEPGGAGADGTRSPGASSWGASTLSIIDRQDLAEGGDLVDCGKEVEYRINYPSARRS